MVRIKETEIGNYALLCFPVDIILNKCVTYSECYIHYCTLNRTTFNFILVSLENIIPQTETPERSIFFRKKPLMILKPKYLFKNHPPQWFSHSQNWKQNNGIEQ